MKLTLNEIGRQTQTDKCDLPNHGHGYLNFYENFLGSLRHEPVYLLEIGIGGYHFPDKGGESLRMWDQYFDHHDTRIIGVDLYKKKLTGFTDRVKTFQADQTDQEFFNQLLEHEKQPDIIIDDASHINELSIKTFNILFDHLKPGGVYIWEDIHTSLWFTGYGGNELPMQPGTALYYLARLAYGLQVDTMQPEYRASWDGHVESIHFMRNTCVLIKRKQ